MNRPGPGGVQDAAPPIVSLISKSEKAQRKLASGTWQHTMLGDNLRVMEITGHPFFIGTLYVPQARSSGQCPHPLITAFLQSANSA